MFDKTYVKTAIYIGGNRVVQGLKSLGHSDEQIENILKEIFRSSMVAANVVATESVLNTLRTWVKDEVSRA